jgi:hypothetical protein
LRRDTPAADLSLLHLLMFIEPKRHAIFMMMSLRLHFSPMFSAAAFSDTLSAAIFFMSHYAAARMPLRHATDYRLFRFLSVRASSTCRLISPFRH